MINIKFGFESVDILMELFDDFVESDDITLEDGSDFDSFIALLL